MSTTPTPQSKILAVTDYGVAFVLPLNRDDLQRVGHWFCNRDCQTPKQIPTEVWEQQRQRNGGYCDACRNMAGAFLAEFSIVPVEVC